LADAFLGSEDALKAAVNIDFAGAFESDDQKLAFLESIKEEPNLRYHGVVDDELKRALFWRAHVLCLPTSFLEGQPISILEAYASGCVVLTSGRPGIRDVFAAGMNGYELSGDSAEEIAAGLRQIVAGREELRLTALRNRRLAEEQYRPSASLARMQAILESPAIAPTTYGHGA
jgi:glycosyltransferase involved in cell wall biosynthesis